MERIKVAKSAGLKGLITVQGGKNAVLPILAASILTKEKVRIHNCPDIEDVRHTIELLKMLGCRVIFNNGTLDIYPETVMDTRVADEYTKSTRSSITFLGAMLGRLKKTVITSPGGCRIGGRPLDIHIKGIRKLGVTIFEKYGDIIAFCDRLKGADIELDFPSVGATENIMLASVLAEGRTVIRNAAREPEIVELAEFLNSMGAKVKGFGEECITIEGVKELRGTEYTVNGDRIVASTYMAAVCICGGKIELLGVKPSYISAVTDAFRRCGLQIRENEKERKIICSMTGNRKKGSRIKNISMITTEPYPGFPTDVQPLFAAVMTYGRGVSRVRETIFEDRFMYVQELKKMGADIEVKNSQSILIFGRERLYGARVKATDLRGGAALVVAGLGAEGETVIEDAFYIDRGYENIVRDLQLLGADIGEEKISEKDDESKE